MLMDNEKRRMSERCGFAEDQRIDDIKKSISNSEYDADEEHAVKRKAIKAIIDSMLSGKPLEESDVSEFLKYYDDIENIKKEFPKV